MIETANKITQPRTGTDFLASSHFQISNDSRWGPKHDSEAYKSIFKRDYPPLPLTKRERIPSPDPAGIMHHDDRYGDDNSITKSHFIEKPLSTRTRGDSYMLRRTNFKGDSDEKLKSFTTTHNEYFPVRSLQDAKAKPSTGKTEWMKSFIPQGDKGKELLPQSDYKSRFLGEQGRSGPVFAKGDQSGRLTITGDPRTQQGQFVTTTKTEFINRYLPKQKLDPSLFASGSNLPQGDQEKCNYRTSTQQECFQAKTARDFKPFNQQEAVRQLRQTTFQLGDQRSPGFLKTTTLDSYACPTLIDRSVPANVNMGKSNFPEGDTNLQRCTERITKTTNDLFFGNPALGYRNPKVDGSKIRTRSNVHLGNAQSQRYYDTSMKTDYTALADLTRTQPSSSLYKSSLPLDYCRGDYVGVATTSSDFPSHRGFNKLVPNPKALQNLKMSHIHPQNPDEMEYGTTHRRTYTPKKTKRVLADVGSLQRSSLPIGTLNQYQ